MSKKRKLIVGISLSVLLLGLLAVIVTVNFNNTSSESLSSALREAVLHETEKISLFGLIDVNPGLISAYVVTAVLLFVALILRVFVIPRFKMIPSKFQFVIEQIVTFFDNLAVTNSPRKNGFLGGYIFSAGCYIFFGTLFELFGVQVITTNGSSVALPAPLSDINGAIMLGCLSYGVILSGGIICNKFKGVLKTLKEFSLPISMSFRLFGALLSGMLVTELVYYSLYLSFVLPVVVAVMFTVLHALIQAYVLTMLTAMFYGEVSEPPEVKKKKKSKNKKSKRVKA